MNSHVASKDVSSLIYFIRRHRVMLDTDLALLYGVETRALNQAVMRNRARFPNDFMFPLTREEIAGISQFVTSSGRKSRLKFSKNVLAFTEQGVAMLSGVLRSSRAIQVNIAIMRAFVQIREVIAARKNLIPRLELLEKRLASHDGILEEHAVEIRTVFQAIRQLMEPRKRKPRIGFKTS